VPSGQKRGNRRTWWQLCVCVLLIGLVLYNPFGTMANHSDGLAYQALARHRATVGASEMQHYASIQMESARVEMTVERIFTGIVVENNGWLIENLHEEELPLRPELVTGMWFRPPPMQ
jgi:hypothetical protein